jgi:hypothetical protein
MLGVLIYMRKNFIIILASSCLIFVGVAFFIPAKHKEPQPSEDQKTTLGCGCTDFTGGIDFGETMALFEGEQINIPSLAFQQDRNKVLGVASEERWVEVDLSEQKLRAWEGDRLFLETAVSTGLPWWPTPTGEFRIWIKLRATKMEGGTGRNYYYLPNVPYVMYFGNNEVPNFRGYGLHGTYWHNDFGNQRSHGCVNLPTNMAKELYYWVGPNLASGKSTAYATAENQGTRIVIHE